VIFAELRAPAASAHEHHSGISETSSEVFRKSVIAHLNRESDILIWTYKHRN
jgi:hypothetical protein